MFVTVQEGFMFILSPFFIFCSCIALFLVLIVVIFRQKAHFNLINKRLASQLETQTLLLDELQSSQQVFNKQLLDLNYSFDRTQVENEQVTKQLEHRIKIVQEESGVHKQSLEQLHNQQPQDKLYSRAFKMVELGADIEEVVRECDIPLAEAEMLISVHRNKTNPS